LLIEFPFKVFIMLLSYDSKDLYMKNPRIINIVKFRRMA